MDLDELVRSNIQEVLDAVSGSARVQPAPASHAEAGDPLEPENASGGPDTSDGTGWLDAKLLEIPQSNDATIRLLKARIKSLEEQLCLALNLNQEKDTELSDLQRQVKVLTQKEVAAAKQQKALEAQVERYKQAAVSAREALSAQEQQTKELRQEGAKADKNRRQVEQESRARDVRLQRALEEVDKYKQLLQDVKMQGREVKDVAKSKHSQALTEVKCLERQKVELLAVLRKQAKLIDVLRRQRAHLEAAQLLAFTEAEFVRMLDVRTG